MRSFAPGGGPSWEVVVGRESWGAYFAIFLPREGEGARQTMLPGASYDEATRALDALDTDGLLDLFHRSEPKTMG